MDKQLDDLMKHLPSGLQEKIKTGETMMFFIKEAGLYEFIQELCVKYGVESKSHFLEVLHDNANEIYEKFDKITESLGE